MSHSRINNQESEPRLALRRARPLLGTLVQIQASGATSCLQTAIDAAFARIERIQQLLSFQDADSELSQLNRQPLYVPRQVDADTYAVLLAAIQFAQLSDGAFDPCVASALEHWDLLPKHVLSSAPLRTAQGSWRDIELLGDRQVCFCRPVRLDLSGIAKGYAVDAAVEVLRAAGADQILVNAGGDLRIAGIGTQEIWLRHPSAPELAGHPLRLKDAALATSGAYYSRQSSHAGEVSALVNPVSHTPFLASRSVSVRAATCLSADALTKVVLFADAPVAERALAACEATAFLLAPDAASHASARLYDPQRHAVAPHAS